MYRGGHILFWKLSSLDLRFEYLPIIQDMANPYSLTVKRTMKICSVIENTRMFDQVY